MNTENDFINRMDIVALAMDIKKGKKIEIGDFILTNTPHGGFIQVHVNIKGLKYVLWHNTVVDYIEYVVFDKDDNCKPFFPKKINGNNYLTEKVQRIFEHFKTLKLKEETIFKLNNF